jgi:hypothetical protein
MDKLIELAELKTDVPEKIKRQIMDDAEAALKEIVGINLGSIGNMVSTIQKTPEMNTLIFTHMPKHVQAVVKVARNIKSSSPERVVFKIQDCGGYLQDTGYKTVDDLARDLIVDYSQFRDVLKSSFGFDIQMLEGEISIILTDKAEIHLGDTLK